MIEVCSVSPSSLRAADARIAALERLQSAKAVQAPSLGSKLGGVPGFLQEVVSLKGHRFVCQLDFDTIRTEKAWPDAALMGCVYVFAREDEKDALAFWQYT